MVVADPNRISHVLCQSSGKIREGESEKKRESQVIEVNSSLRDQEVKKSFLVTIGNSLIIIKQYITAGR